MTSSKEPIYPTADFEHLISAGTLSHADRETQIEVMRTWFLDNYEDPAQSTPYESAEGGYIYIWGGPYDAEDVLGSEFGDIVPFGVIEELVDELEATSPVWSGHPGGQDLASFLIEDIATLTTFLGSFRRNISDIEQLLDSEIQLSVKSCFYRLLYVNVITALETYLSDAFIGTVFRSPELMRRFVETTPEFRDEKASVSEVFRLRESIEEKARDYLADVVWHNLARVQPMYRDTLRIGFPENTGELYRAILVRHDIVHRNGKTRDGKEHIVRPAGIRKLIETVESFVSHIDAQLAKLARESGSDGNDPGSIASR